MIYFLKQNFYLAPVVTGRLLRERAICVIMQSQVSRKPSRRASFDGSLGRILLCGLSLRQGVCKDDLHKQMTTGAINVCWNQNKINLKFNAHIFSPPPIQKLNFKFCPLNVQPPRDGRIVTKASVARDAWHPVLIGWRVWYSFVTKWKFTNSQWLFEILLRNMFK